MAIWSACNIDTEQDPVRASSILPVKRHEIIANILWQVKIKTFFMVHFYTDQATIFLEERFLKVACDSRNTVCNRFSIPHQAITVLPYHEDMELIGY